MRGSRRFGPGRCRLVVTAALAALLAGCVPYSLEQVLDGPQGKALAINPADTVVRVNGTVTFVADGGIPPYTYALISGGGSLDPVTGVYTAPAASGSARVRVTDKTGKAIDATITIQTAALAISPTAISVLPGASVTFVPLSGNPPYTFSMKTSGSGSPSVTSATGVYTAGASVGTDVVQLTDATSVSVTATVTVVAVASNVNYTVPGVSLVPPWTVSTAIPAGSTFTLMNSGTAAGTQAVSWELYLSADTVLGPGDIEIGSGTVAVGALPAAGASITVPLTGAVPAVSSGLWNVLVRVSAADDTTPGDNTSAASAIALDPLNVDYTPQSVTNTGPTNFGAAANGTFTIQNAGTADGAAPVNWAVFASRDTALDGSDFLVAAGSHLAVPGSSTSTPISYSGYWPSGSGLWYILVVLTAPDDLNATNNVTPGASAPSVNLTAPGSPDYTVKLSPGIPWSGVVGTAVNLTGTTQIQVQNVSSVGGIATVTWAVYLSTDKVLDGGDTLLDSGSLGGMPGSSSQWVTFNGSWLPTAGTWWLIAKVSATDDLNPLNDTGVAAHLCVTGDSRYQELASDNNDGAGPKPPAGQTSATGATVTAGQTLVIEGTMDAFGGRDTYRFTLAPATTQLSMKAFWATLYNDIDLSLWDTTPTLNLGSTDTAADTEPGGASTFTATGLSNGVHDVSAGFVSGISGSQGSRYVIVVQGLP